MLVGWKEPDTQLNITKINITSDSDPVKLRRSSLDQVFRPNEAIVLEKANQIVM